MSAMSKRLRHAVRHLAGLHLVIADALPIDSKMDDRAGFLSGDVRSGQNGTDAGDEQTEQKESFHEGETVGGRMICTRNAFTQHMEPPNTRQQSSQLAPQVELSVLAGLLVFGN
jgi:hypothetical protein